MSYRVELSARSTRDLDRLDRPTQKRILGRLEQIAAAPRNPRLSAPLTHKEPLRKSRVGGWRIIFTVNDAAQKLFIVTIERRGQVYRSV